MHIRPAADSDADAIALLLGELGYPADAGAVRRRLAGIFSHPHCAVLIACHDGRPVGLGCVQVYPTLQADTPGALITALVVTGAARGAGVGRRLVQELEGFARSAGATRIMVTTANERSGAHIFYEKAGYRLTGRRYAKMHL